MKKELRNIFYPPKSRKKIFRKYRRTDGIRTTLLFGFGLSFFHFHMNEINRKLNKKIPEKK
jgi:hypothetical protein